MYNKNHVTVFEVIWAAIVLILIGLLYPFLGFCKGWIIGWIIKKTFGVTVIQGLGLLGLNITKDSLPLICGTLGVIGGFFKNTVINK